MILQVFQGLFYTYWKNELYIYLRFANTFLFAWFEKFQVKNLNQKYEISTVNEKYLPFPNFMQPKQLW